MAQATATTHRRSGGFWGRIRQSDLSEALWGYFLISPWLVGLLIFVAGPMLYSVYLSLTRYNLMSAPQWVGAFNYGYLAADPLVWQSLKVTAIYTFLGVPMRVVLALLVAMLLNQQVRAMPLFRTIFYLPSVVSGVAVAILWMWILSPEYGLLNSALAKVGITGPRWLMDQDTALFAMIVMSLWGVGANMVIFLAALQGVPQHLYEAADVEGASRLQKTWHVTIPSISPSTFFVLIMSIIGSFQVFTQGFVMTNGGPNNSTLFYVLYLYRNAFQLLRMGYASALAWVLFIIIMACTALVLRSSALWVYYEGELKK